MDATWSAQWLACAMVSPGLGVRSGLVCRVLFVPGVVAVRWQVGLHMVSECGDDALGWYW
jgi:hypothetical protein